METFPLIIVQFREIETHTHSKSAWEVTYTNDNVSIPHGQDRTNEEGNSYLRTSDSSVQRNNHRKLPGYALYSMEISVANTGGGLRSTTRREALVLQLAKDNGSRFEALQKHGTLIVKVHKFV